MTGTATIPIEQLRAAWELLAEKARPTTFVRSEALDDVLGAQVTLACETFQLTGSFKFRGAFNLLSTVPNREIVSASSGNFGQAVALAARMLGKTCTVVMPDTSSKVKIEAVRRNGAAVELVDTTRVSRMDRVRQLMAEQKDAFYAPAFDEVRVVAGNSSLGREIFESGMDFDFVVVPVGGGGLISGVIAASRCTGPGGENTGCGAGDCERRGPLLPFGGAHREQPGTSDYCRWRADPLVGANYVADCPRRRRRHHRGARGVNRRGDAPALPLREREGRADGRPVSRGALPARSLGEAHLLRRQRRQC